MSAWLAFALGVLAGGVALIVVEVCFALASYRKEQQREAEEQARENARTDALLRAVRRTPPVAPRPIRTTPGPRGVA